jgi:hypothetical protein
MTQALPHGQIQFAVLDPMLYGTARALDYLGMRGQDMIDRIGEGIIAYGLSRGYFERSNDPHQFIANVGKFFIENGYLSDARIDQNGDTLDIMMRNWRYLPLMKKLREHDSYLLTCPFCIANNAVRKSMGLSLGERLSETVTRDGVYTIKIKMIHATENTQSTVVPTRPADFSQTMIGNQMDESLGLPAFESVAYGLACGFDYLGAQAQLILDNVGKATLGFLREEASLTLPNDLESALEALATFFADHGLADKIQVSLSKDKVDVEFKNSRYLPVLEKLLQEERKLFSCPFTLGARAIIRDHGLQVGEVKWRADITDAAATMSMRDSKEQQFDEDATGRLMDQV